MAAQRPGTACRLTEDDRAAMRGAVVEMVRRCPGALVVPVPAGSLDVLARTAARAIGCTLLDLRPVEVAWLREMAGATVADVLEDERATVPAA